MPDPKYTNSYLRTVQFADACELAAMDTSPPPAVVEGAVEIARGERCLSYGPPNVGKTWLVLYLMLLAVIAGHSVVALCGEGVLRLIAGRLRALCVGLGVDLEALDGQLLVGQGAFPVVDEDGYRGLAELVEARQPDLFVLDPWVAFGQGLDENSATSIHLGLSVLDDVVLRSGSALLLVHHAGKRGDYRGSSAIEGWADSIYRMAPSRGGVRLTNQKQRWRARQEPLLLEIRHDADSTLLTLTPAPSEPASGALERVLGALRKHGGWCSATKVRKLASASGGGISGATIAKHLDRLVQEGVVEAESGPRGARRFRTRTDQDTDTAP